MSPRSPRALALLVLLLLTGCGTVFGSQDPRGVLVVAVDGLRADHVGVLGYDRPTTPGLDALADKGVTFEDAFAAAPRARPSHASLLTGCDPYVTQRFLTAGLEARRWNIPDAVPRLAVELLAAGYETAAFADGTALSPGIGFERGFQHVLRIEPEAPLEHTREQVDRLLGWLRPRSRGRWFAYLHLADLERSWKRPDRDWERYFPPRPGREAVPPVGSSDEVFFAVPYSRWRGGSRTLGEYEAAYDGHLVKLDRELADLWAGLRRLGIEETTTIAVVGSHGLQFGEAGLFLEAGRYSVADLRVPWILKPRAGVLAGAGSVRPELVSLTDLAPTLLELEAIEIPRSMHGTSLVPLLVDGEPLERSYVFASCGLQQGCAVIGPSHCLEYIAPGQLPEGARRRAWFGEVHEEQGAEAELRFYDRRATPHPPLDAPGVRSGESFRAYRAVAQDWLSNLHDARNVLQRRRGGNGEVTDERRSELVELGLVDEDALR